MPTELTRRGVLAGASASGVGALGDAFAKQSAPLPAGGVNLAGAEFGVIPGVHGREYLYPPRRHFDYFRGLGFSLIRLPFKWERLQPDLNAAFAPEEQSLLVTTTRYATAGGQQLILDPHNFAKRRIVNDGWTAEHGIGSAAVPVASFADFWSRLATLFKDDGRLVFGLMNEPVGITVDAWLQAANAAIAAIRAAGATNRILVPGIEYSGAHSWHRRGNIAMAGIVDPRDNFAFDVHQYFDSDSSGTKPDAMSGTIGSERIEAFQAWARQNGFKAVLGEFNGGRNRTGYNALNDLCQELTANADVWLGWAAWAGGPRWPDDEMFNLEPWRDGRIREQTAILAKYARPESSDFWVADGAAIDLDFARNRFRGAAPPLAESRKPSSLQPSGALLALLQSSFTLVMTLRDVGNPVVCDLLSAGGQPFLRRSADGALEAASIQTAAQSLKNWQTKRRVAIAVDRQSRRIAIGVTGAKSVQAETTLPEMRNVTIGSPNTGQGTLCRVTAYRDFRDADALDALIA
jgi:endoglucanase